ncbi:hypothetical protein D9758_005835 [Tetrapyrgos nigripes]|uniref:F5/8 type C domain-containing protein n=1 Tax=Tetrapyrgos nigripes TaxID=182062 RepID=A0A8H5G2X1_9AGAR|nr:hypothetical protein D9758_005835 [Tetrapyrgos nigripes]
MQAPPPEPSQTLSYSIVDSSSHSGKYSPRNILIDNPADQGSRWSTSVQSNSNHWILLRLNNLAVLKTITFGKYHKSHPCTMKEFKVFVGTKPEHLTEVLHASLRNDSIPETFSIKHINNIGLCFPARYIKILPLSAHGQSFNSSIWHVSMTGIADEVYVDGVKRTYDEFRETQVLRHVLKHLRQRRLLTPYQSILSRSNLQVEHPLVSKLHQCIVLQGDWDQAIDLLNDISDAGLFDSYLHLCQPYAVWKQIHDTDDDGDIPPLRGGHAMCIDHVNGLIYLFGGWDGVKSLDDFWVYDIKKGRWSRLSRATSREHNAPGPRSCHKMVHDSKTGCIYVLGRLGDDEAQDSGPARSGADAPSTPTPSSSSKPVSSEFYRYHIESAKWTCLNYDAASSNGPPLIFDHQMVMDSEAQMLYVFGGRVVDGDWNSLKFSGLYSYSVQINKWRLLQHPDNSSHASVMIPSRFGHSMVLEPNTRTLYIFAGQRDSKYLSDMYAYDIATNTTTEIFSNFTSAGGPEACFTQRAVIDPRLHEIYVFCGLTRNPQQNGSSTYLPSEPSNWVYRYHPRPGQWTKMLSELDISPATNGFGSGTGEVGESGGNGEGGDYDSLEEPVPRYAHQVVYDPSTRTVYMHGGNAGMVGPLERSLRDGIGEETQTEQDPQPADGNSDGEGAEREKRLDDFWKMSLVRPSTKEIIRQAKYRLRQQQFREMCDQKPAVEALSFLQNEVSSVVDHSNPKEAEVFRSLLTHLVMASPLDSLPTPLAEEDLVEDEAGTPPRKRTRATTPSSSTSGAATGGGMVVEEFSASPSTNGIGKPLTNGFGTSTNGQANGHGHDHMSAHRRAPSSSSLKAGINLGVDKDRLQSTVDPIELEVLSSSSSYAAQSSLAAPISQKKFQRRNEVFESLLEFIAREAKQPEGSLLDFMDVDMGMDHL